MLVAGDEFGPLAGFPGSDDGWSCPRRAGRCSSLVGPEPGGVPKPVLHLGGGPERFRHVVAAQAELYAVELPAQATADDAWVLVEEGFVPAREHVLSRSSRSATGTWGARGRSRTRGVGTGHVRSGRVRRAGGTGRAAGARRVARLGQPRIDHRGVPAPAARTIVEHRRVLDMRQGNPVARVGAPGRGRPDLACARPAPWPRSRTGTCSSKSTTLTPVNETAASWWRASVPRRYR